MRRSESYLRPAVVTGGFLIVALLCTSACEADPGVARVSEADTSLGVAALAQRQASIRRSLGTDSLTAHILFLPLPEELESRTGARVSRPLTFQTDQGRIAPVFTSEYKLHWYVMRVNEKEHLANHSPGYEVQRYSAAEGCQLAALLDTNGVKGAVLDRSIHCPQATHYALGTELLREPGSVLRMWIISRSVDAQLAERWSRRVAQAMREQRWLDAKEWLSDFSECVPGEPRMYVLFGICGLGLRDDKIIRAVDEELGKLDPESQRAYRRDVMAFLGQRVSQSVIASLIGKALEMPLQSTRLPREAPAGE